MAQAQPPDDESARATLRMVGALVALHAILSRDGSLSEEPAAERAVAHADAVLARLEATQPVQHQEAPRG